MHRLRSVGPLALAAVLLACEDGGENISGLDPIAIARIEIAPKVDTILIADSILPKDTVRFRGTIIGRNGEVLDGRLAWSVSDTTIARVDSSGLVVPRVPGTVQVRASAGEIATATLVVERAQRRIEITASRTTILVDDPIDAGDTVTYRAIAYDADDAVVPGATFTWTTSDPGIATVEPNGLVRAVGLGTATIVASNGELTASREVLVRPFVHEVTVSAPASRFVVGDTVWYTANATGPEGETLVGRTYAWASSNPAVATIDASTGMLVAVGAGTTEIRATTGFVLNDVAPAPDVSAPEILPRVFLSVDAGGDFTCGRVSLDRTYCWGQDSIGQLGVRPDTICHNAYFMNFRVPCTLVPLRTLAESNPRSSEVYARPFKQISTGRSHVCALDADGRAFCWGAGESGQIGNGTDVASDVPTLVTSALRFSSIAVGGSHTCALDASGAAWCWGNDATGQLGNLKKANSTTPIPVEGGHRFTQLAAGPHHTCGVALDATGWCWGDNSAGQLGDGTTTQRDTAVLVRGGLSFRSLSASVTGAGVTCGVTTGGAAYCWGEGVNGQLGSMPASASSVPRAVAGGITFDSLSVGWQHACGIATSGATYCWGTYNLGTVGSELVGHTPTPVPNAPPFTAITAGARHACGLTAAGEVYCWGSNILGPFGDELQALWREEPQRTAMPQDRPPGSE